MSSTSERVSSGLEELDSILKGGFIRRSSYLVRGGPGQGKTTLGLHFLASADAESKALFIGFQEPEDQLKANAAAIGIDISNIHFLSLAPDERFFADQQGYDVFSSADVEQAPLAEEVTGAVEQLSPTHVFVDSMTQLRFLSSDLYQYRKQVLSLLRYFREQNATTLFTSECTAETSDEDLQFMADGVINLEAEEQGSSSFLKVTKFRGSGFMRGAHQMRVGEQGLELFPKRLPPRVSEAEEERFRYGTGVTKLDEMLSGGLEAGTVSLITGPSGVGKSTLSSLFVAQAAKQNRKAAIYLFEEERASFLYRAESLGIPLKSASSQGYVSLEQIEPMRYLGDEFASMVHDRVENEGVEVVVLDSVGGFELTLEEREHSKMSVHAFAKSLSRRGVSVILINETEAMTGQFKVSERGISYLADNVIFLRFVEAAGELKKSIGVLKKRLSKFDNKLYTYEICRPGFKMEESVADQGLQGVLAGQNLARE